MISTSLPVLGGARAVFWIFCGDAGHRFPQPERWPFGSCPTSLVCCGPRTLHAQRSRSSQGRSGTEPIG